MKTALLIATSVAALSIGVAAQAQQTSSSWTGAYVGAQAGWGWGWGHDKNNETIAFDNNLDGNFNNTVNTAAGANAFSPGFCAGAPNGSTPAGGCAKDDDGFEFGARAGYDWQIGNWVVGAVVEGSRADVTDSVGAFSTTPAFYTMTRTLKELGAVRLRAGYAMDRNLIYVTGGAAVGKVKHTFNTSNLANQFTTTENDRSATGYQLGGGAERKVTDNVTLGLEYIYTQLKDDGYTVRAGGPAPATNPFILVNAGGTDFNRTNKDFDIHSVRLTAAYRF